MDVKSLRAELNALQIKASHFGELAKAGTITEAQANELHSIADRAVTVKAQLVAAERGEKNADLMREVSNLGGVEETTHDGFGGATGSRISSAGAKGFITPASVKGMARVGAAHGLKALVASGSTVTPVSLDPQPIQLGQPVLGLMSLIPTKVRETPNYSYLRQTVATNNADVVDPGDQKPTSVYTVASVDAALKVYAHMSEYVDKYLLEDNDDLESFLEGQLRDGLFRKVTADAIETFGSTSGIQTQAFTGTAADSIYAGASKVSDLGFSPSLVIVNVADYDAIRLSKDEEGRYYGGNPFDGNSRPGIWGFQTLISSDIDAGTALVLDTSKVGLSTDRAGVEHVADAISGFDKNQVRFRTEGRFNADVFQPAAIAKVTLTSGE